MGAFVNFVYEYANYIILAGMLLQMIIILQVLVKSEPDRTQIANDTGKSRRLSECHINRRQWKRRTIGIETGRTDAGFY